jgi:hypothetical protein
VNKLVVVCVALGVAALIVSASAAEAQQPLTPEQVQAWAVTPPRQSTSLVDPAYSPIDAIHILDHTYTLMLQDLSQNSPGDAWTKAGEGSKSVDHFRRALVNSPDKGLNKLTNRALNQVGDVFDEVDATHTQRAAQRASSSNLLWAQVEAALKQYGVDTGEAWSLSTAR